MVAVGGRYVMVVEQLVLWEDCVCSDTGYEPGDHSTR